MRCIVAAISLLTIISTASANEAMECGVRIFQTDSETGTQTLLWCDTIAVTEGKQISGAPLAFSMEIACESIDSTSANFSVHVVTFGASPFSTSKSFSVEFGLPATISGIAVKDRGKYALEVKPLRTVTEKTAACPFDPKQSTGFTISPSANFDLHYADNSFGSFYWTAAREILEGKYRLYQKRFNLTLPGKYAVYLLPCETADVIWDSRFGVSIDPSRSQAHVLYSLASNSTDAVVVCQLATLRTFGYAPPLLSEGIASYLSFTLPDAKRLASEGKIPQISSLLDTRAFLQMSPRVSDRCAATLARYLIDAYGIDTFMSLYRRSTDLTLASDVSHVYGKSVTALEKEWRTFIDTCEITVAQLRAGAAEAEMMQQYESMLDFSKGLIVAARTREDSLISLPFLERACLFSGDYYGATDARLTLWKLDTTRTASRVTLGAYRMMSGQYEIAGNDLAYAASRNPDDKIAAFNMALWHLYHSSDTIRARDLLTNAGSVTAEGQTMYESRIQLAELLKQSANLDDRRKAREMFQEGVNGLLVQLQASMASSSTMLWLGAGYLGLGDSPTASDFLNTALMLESRPFYKGLIYLYLGKVADQLGDHEGAKAWYGRVLSNLSADYHQKQSRWLIDHPWSQRK